MKYWTVEWNFETQCCYGNDAIPTYLIFDVSQNETFIMTQQKSIVSLRKSISMDTRSDWEKATKGGYGIVSGGACLLNIAYAPVMKQYMWP